MYFNYSNPQNYVRTLTQGVRLTDTRSTTENYIRLTTQTTRITDTRNLKAEYKRTALQSVISNTSAKALFTFLRKCFDNAISKIGLSRFSLFNIFVFDNTNVISDINNKRDINLKINNFSNSNDDLKRSKGNVISIIDNIKLNDNKSYCLIFIRSIQEIQSITDIVNKINVYFRGLYIEAGNNAETEHWGNSYRIITNTAHAEGFVFRHLLIFIKLVSAAFVRDFILRRFLIAREELILKSCLTKELILDSKIN